MERRRLMRTPPASRRPAASASRADHVPVELGERRTQQANSCTAPAASAAPQELPGRRRRQRGPAPRRPVARPVGRHDARRRDGRRPTTRRGGPSTTQRRWSVRAQLLDVAERDHRPALDDADPVAQRLDQLELVRREQHRHARRGLVAQHPAHHVDRDGVEAGERLVEHQDLGVVDERRGQLHALLVAQRQLEDLVAAPLRDAQHLGPVLHRARVADAASQPVQPRQVDQLVADLHARVQAALLGHVPDAPPDGEVDRPAVPAHLARVGLQHAEHDPHGRRLARPVGADEADDLARADLHREVAQRADGAVGLVEGRHRERTHGFHRIRRSGHVPRPDGGDGVDLQRAGAG